MKMLSGTIFLKGDENYQYMKEVTDMDPAHYTILLDNVSETCINCKIKKPVISPF